MNIDEIRNSKEYINAFAEYIKSGDDTEGRALLSDAVTVSGTAGVPTPTFVEDRIRTADGDLWNVIGDPKPWQQPMTGWEPGSVVQLEKWEVRR